MPLLLQDLAERFSAGNQWAADRLDREARDLGRQRAAAAQTTNGPTTTTPAPNEPQQSEALRQKAVESARQATGYAVSQASQAEEFWRLALAGLIQEPAGGDAERLLRTLLDVFESGRQLVRKSRALWEIAEQLGAAAGQRDELAQADERLTTWTAEATAALEHRARPWQPADPARLAAGLELAREGKTVTADEARAWFRRG
jgi:hypothetical protein